MDRRAFLAGGAALAAIARSARADADDLRTAAREAWLYGLPLVVTSGLRAATLAAGGQVGAFYHQRKPRGPGPGDLSAPDTDVLCSYAWINLASGPATIRLPPSDGRYLTVTLMDMYTNVIETLGAGGAGEEGRSFTLIGPPARVGVAGYTMPEPRLPPMRKVIRSRGAWVWALARTEIAGQSDLEGAHSLQDGLELMVKPGGSTPAASAALDADWSDYFYAAQKLVDENPPPPYETDFFRRIAQLQLGIAGGFERARFADADLAAIQQGVADARTLAADLRPTESVENGWLYPTPALGDYGQDFLNRAQTALALPGSPKSEQMLALRALAPDGGLAFNSASHHRLTLPGPPPAAGFWSLSLYELAPDGRLFPTQNPIGRYAIGSLTQGLRQRPTGEIDIWIGQTDPGGTHTSNWLPTPAQGSFALVLRAYRPGADLLQRNWRAPPVEVLTAPPPATPPRRRR